jgi:protein O-mannosyl-transferase
MKNTDKKKNLKSKENNTQFYVLAGIILLTIIVFSNSLLNGFTNWDDTSYIIDNPVVKEFSFNKIGTIFSTLSDAIYQPLTILTFAIEYKIAGLNPGLFHMDNLILHVLNVLLIFYLFNLITGRWEAAAIVAVLFGIHPLHVESVSWITERKDVLYTVFFIGGLIMYLKYIKQTVQIKYLAYTFLFFILSIISKPTAATFPLVLLLLDYYFNRGFVKKVLIEKIPFILVSLVIFIISYIANPLPPPNEYFYPEYNFIDKIFFAFYSLSFYIVKLVAPIYLSTLYPFPSKEGGMLPVVYYLSPVFILAVIFLIYKLKKFRKEILFGSLFFFLTIAPMIQLKQIGHAITADRFTYVAFLGLFFIVGKMFLYVSDKYKIEAKKYFLIILVIFIAVFSILSINRNKVWNNSITLWTDVIRNHPDNPIPYKNRGNALAEVGKFEASISDFTNALKLNYRRAATFYDRANSKNYLKDYRGAIEDYDSSIALRPEEKHTYYNRGLSKFYNNDLKGALDDFNKTIELGNNTSESYSNRGLVKSKLSDSTGALSDFNKAIEINPKNGLAYYNRGNLKYELHKQDEACEDLKTASVFGVKDATEKIKEFCK